MNNWIDGLKRIHLHLLLGLPFAVVTYYGGWAGAVTFAAWRMYEEYLDWKTHQDTFAKSIIDLTSQTILVIIAAVVKS